MLLIALALDCAYPFHRGIMYKIHPVHTAYFMSLKLYKLFPRTKLAGVVIWFIVVVVHCLIYAFVLYLSHIVNRMLWILVASYILKVSLSLKLLIDHVYVTGLCLENNDVDCARDAIAGAVRRDVSALGEGHIVSAAIETLFENIVDGFISPLLYYLIIGPLGAFIQRIINTLDAALGYKVGDFVKVGWFSAKADDVINLVPFRITMIIIMPLCFFVNGLPKNGMKIYTREKHKIESINARTVIAFVSGCLGIRLEKKGFYSIGMCYDLPKAHDIFRALKLAIYTISVHICLLYVLFLIIFGW